MTKLALTFPPTLRYACEIESCRGCCSLFEEIELSPGDVETLEGLGYSSFCREGRRRVLRRPCPFLRGKLCEIHVRHGASAKPGVCRKYPFTVSLLDNGWVLVDVKWACMGVGAEEGEALTSAYIKRELRDFLSARGGKIPVGVAVPLSDEGDKRVSWEGVKKLYDYASEEVLLRDGALRDKIGKIVYLLREFTEACYGGDIASLEEVRVFLKGLRPEAWRMDDAPWDAEITYYGIIDELLSTGITPNSAAKRLGLGMRMSSPAELVFSRNAEELYSLYMSQCLRETLSKPWSLRASFYWTMGVMGLVDFVTKCTTRDEVSGARMREAIAVVDFLNKGSRGFRDHAYPLYPELGLHYLSMMLSPARR